MMINGKPWGVKGLTDSPRAPIVAKAKIGERGEKGEPRRLDYIIFVEPQTGRRIPEYQAVFGDRPAEFAALLSADRIQYMVDVAWKRYGQTGIKCRGDGEIGIDRTTGEQRVCAGPYNADHPEQHACEFARPTKRGGKELPPECKPVLSMRLVVPQVPGLGVVQIDTGGVASSIPTLMSQLQMIEDRSRDENGNPRMAGIAVRVSIRPFRDRMGGTAYAWQIEPLREPEAAALRTHIEGLVRIEGQLMSAQVLPPLDETPEPDIYGLPAGGPDVRVAEGDGTGVALPPVPDDSYPEGARPISPEPVVATAETADVTGIQETEPPDDLSSEILGQEALYVSLVQRLAMPEAKTQSFIRTQQDNRATAASTGDWAGYSRWLNHQTKELGLRLDQAQGALV